MNNRTSINVKYDIYNTEVLEHYLATKTHTRVINSVLGRALSKEKGIQRSHIIYGAYGTGKSFLSTVIAQLLSQQITSKKNQKLLIDKFVNVDEQTTELINDMFNHSIEYIPVIINGFEGEFDKVVLDRIKVAIKEKNLRLRLPGVEAEISKQISTWKRDFPSTYEKLLDILNTENISLYKFVNEIKDSNEDYINNFVDWFPQLTSGQEFIFDSGKPFVDEVAEICEQLESRGYGLFFVYDEFGRYLTSVTEFNINIIMQQLQDLAELSNDLYNFLQLYILHKPASTYFNSFKNEYRMEFSKIEKRFIVFDIKNDYKTFTTITTKVVAEALAYKPPRKVIDQQISEVLNYRTMFEEAFDFNSIDSVIDMIYPLHPVSLLLLPKLSNVFGQNERTLFTFLHDKSRNGIYGFFKKDKGLFYPDYLADYFLKESDNLLLNELTIYKLYLKQSEEIKKIFPNDYTELLRVYKLIMIWNITNQNLILNLSESLLSYSLGLSIDVIKNSLDKLSKVKFIKFNPFKNDYELFEGSSLDIEKAISKTLATEKYSYEDIIATLNKYNPYRVIYPVEYNANREITRFAILNFIDKDKLNTDSDLEISVFINNKIDTITEGLVGNLDCDFDNFKQDILKIFAIDKMLANRSLLRNYKNLDIELQIEKEYTIKKLDFFYNLIFTKNTHFYLFKNDKVEHSFESKRKLEKFLSSKFSEIFVNEIEIVNNQINMFQITRIQERATIRVIDAILNEKTQQLPFDGSQPHDLIYYSIYKNKSMDALVELIQEKLIAEGNLVISDMMHYLTSPHYGYGLRPKTVLLVILYAIADLLPECMFFNDGSFVPSIDGETLYFNTLDLTNKYKIVYSHFEHKNRDFLEVLAELFPDKTISSERTSKVVSICSGMYNWMINLPLITQQKVNLGPIESMLLNHISQTRSNPQSAIDNIVQSFDVEALHIYKESIDNHFQNYIENLNNSIKAKVLQQLEQLPKETMKIHKGSKLIQVLNKNLNYVEEYSKDLDNTVIERWPLPMFEMLQNKVYEDLLALNQDVNYKVLDVDGHKKYVHTTNLSVKGKIIEENLYNTIEATKNTITPNELYQILMNLMDIYIK